MKPKLVAGWRDETKTSGEMWDLKSLFWTLISYGNFVTREKGLIVPITYETGIQGRKEYFLKTNIMYFKS